jgi:hypothetical protein
MLGDNARSIPWRESLKGPSFSKQLSLKSSSVMKEKVFEALTTCVKAINFFVTNNLDK